LPDLENGFKICKNIYCPVEKANFPPNSSISQLSHDFHCFFHSFQKKITMNKNRAPLSPKNCANRSQNIEYAFSLWQTALAS